MLPAEEEPHEIRRADRLDLGAQPVQRVAMDAREQRPSHHSSALSPGVKRPRSTTPSASSSSSAASASAGEMPSESASAAAVTGPVSVSRPRRISAIASPRVQDFASRDAGGCSDGGD